MCDGGNHQSNFLVRVTTLAKFCLLCVSNNSQYCSFRFLWFRFWRDYTFARHLAFAIELRAFAYHQLGCDDRASQTPSRQHFNPLARNYFTIDLTSHSDLIGRYARPNNGRRGDLNLVAGNLTFGFAFDYDQLPEQVIEPVA